MSLPESEKPDFGYTITKKCAERVKILTIKIYVSLENLLYMDKLNGLLFDPEEVEGESIFNPTSSRNPISFDANSYNGGRTGVGTPSFKSASFAEKFGGPAVTQADLDKSINAIRNRPLDTEATNKGVKKTAPLTLANLPNDPTRDGDVSQFLWKFAEKDVWNLFMNTRVINDFTTLEETKLYEFWLKARFSLATYKNVLKVKNANGQIITYDGTNADALVGYYVVARFANRVAFTDRAYLAPVGLNQIQQYTELGYTLAQTPENQISWCFLLLMKKLFTLSLITVVLMQNACTSASKQAAVRNDSVAQTIVASSPLPGADQLSAYLPLLKGKKMCLLREKVNLKFGFAPEHGFRGNVERGEKVSNDVDPKTGLPLYTLYGGNEKQDSIVKSVDVDNLIADVGARFYTYITSLHRVIWNLWLKHKQRTDSYWTGLIRTEMQVDGPGQKR
ncbi:hypothetical protein FQR65_LT16048 [Abscondita terminalis]|nr:hypothetical protein FQR65_LT16048 [Abscondita terminalis]